LQILVSPLSERRQKKIRTKVDAIKSGKGTGIFAMLKSLLPKKDEKQEESQSKEYSSQQLGDIEKKGEDEGFHVSIRSIAISPYPQKPPKMLEDLARSFSQYNYIGLNSFTFEVYANGEQYGKMFAYRSIVPLHSRIREFFFPKQKAILNIKELASIYHFPHSRINKNPRIVRQKFKIVPAPDDLSTEGVLL
jgi:hypothetical protein